MSMYIVFLLTALGVVGIAIIMVIWFKYRGASGRIMQEQLLQQLKEYLRTVSLEVLSRNNEEFLRVAGEILNKQTQLHQKELENKKDLIEQTFDVMKERLQEVQRLVADFKEDRKQQFGAINSQLRIAAEQTARLQETTSRIQNALASSRIRGQWGERMAEDILRLAGFIEGINYKKQKALQEGRPDFTFLLPQNLIVNMDVKFPFDNYNHYFESSDKVERQRYKEQFLRDVKVKIKEVTTRNYIDSSQNTIDYVILFIPNEQVYAFINEADSSILDEALKNKVIICSPLTLYAILAVIRQAVDNFNLERTAGQILSILGNFKKQWNMFIESMDKMGKRLEEARKEFDALVSTRRTQLERPLRQIEELRVKEEETRELPFQKHEKINNPAD